MTTTRTLAARLVDIADTPATHGATVAARNANLTAGAAARNTALTAAADAYITARGHRTGDKVRVIDPAAARIARGNYGTFAAGTLTIGARGGYTVAINTAPAGRPPHYTAHPIDPDNITVTVAEALTLARAELAEATEARPLIVVPCGAAKLDHAAPAGDLYTGALHRSARTAAARLAADLDADVVILSALHGITDLDTVLEPYNVTIGDPAAIGPIELAAQLAARNVYDRRLIVIGGARYVDLIVAAGGHHAEAPLAGCPGLGHMRGRCSAIARTGLLDPAAAGRLGPAGTHAEQLALAI